MLLTWRAITTINPQSLPSELIQDSIERSRSHAESSRCGAPGSIGDGVDLETSISPHTSPGVQEATTSLLWEQRGLGCPTDSEDASPLAAESASPCSTGMDLGAVVLRPTKHLQRDHMLEFTPPSSFKEKLALFNTLAEAEAIAHRTAQDVSAPVPRRQSASSLVRRMQQRAGETTCRLVDFMVC